LTSDILKQLKERKATKTVSDKAQSFWEFHTANPTIYLALVELAKGLRRQGYSSWSIKGLIETVRCRSALEGMKVAEINNNHTAYYARLLMSNEPELNAFFELRKNDSISVFGNTEEV
jgi:hypothetical protein